MDEFGIYTWQDGRMYEGFYKDDKKHGWGVYTWSDQKRYAGWWSHGKQHSLGIFISKDGKRKPGIWQDGKKVKWFTAEEAKSIENNEADITQLYSSEDGAVRAQEFPMQFTAPLTFNVSRERLLSKIKELGI